MKKIYINIGKFDYLKIKEFLLSDGVEHAVFLLAKAKQENQLITFEVQKYYLVPEKETDSSSYDLSLTDEAQSKILKLAWANDCSLIEIHSHPFTHKNAGFSSYDLEGFKEFVPHVWWRLKGKPYAAIVMGQNDYDALAWTDTPHESTAIEGISIDGILQKPTNDSRSFKIWKKRI